MDVAPETDGTVSVKIVYGHNHEKFIVLDHHGTTYTYRRTSSAWVLVSKGNWME